MIEMNTPKIVGCLLCGFRTENVLEIETFQEFGCPNCNKEQDAKAKREWERNECEGCFSPLRDCVCELCEVCEALVTQCDCNRCEDCGTIYSAEDSAENLNEDNNCATCANEIGE